MPLLSAFGTMLPRLQAEESLRRVMELHAAAPEAEPRYRERIIRGWQRQAEPERDAARLTPEQLAVRLALAGIGVKRVQV